MGEEGFEPSCPFGHNILSVARKPFRHSPYFFPPPLKLWRGAEFYYLALRSDKIREAREGTPYHAIRGKSPPKSFKGFVPIITKILRRRWESNPRIRVLQTLALPLGYDAKSQNFGYYRGSSIFYQNTDTLRISGQTAALATSPHRRSYNFISNQVFSA